MTLNRKDLERPFVRSSQQVSIYFVSKREVYCSDCVMVCVCVCVCDIVGFDGGCDSVCDGGGPGRGVIVGGIGGLGYV